MPHISLVTLGVEDVAGATRFYEGMGWRRSSASTPEVSFFHGSTAVLAVWGRKSLAEDAGISADAKGSFSGVGLSMNVPSEAEVDTTLERAVRAGGAIARAAKRAEWGGYAGYFRDPEGHLWEVAHNPFFELTPDGHVVLPGAN